MKMRYRGSLVTTSQGAWVLMQGKRLITVEDLDGVDDMEVWVVVITVVVVAIMVRTFRLLVILRCERTTRKLITISVKYVVKRGIRVLSVLYWRRSTFLSMLGRKLKRGARSVMIMLMRDCRLTVHGCGHWFDL